MAKGNFASDGHALVSGMVLGDLLKHGVEVTPVWDDDDDYTPVIEINVDLGGEYTQTVRVRVMDPADESP